MTRKIFIIADIILIALTLIFIFGNSLQNSESSDTSSESITDIVEQLPPVHDAIQEEKITQGELHEVVRSLAHVAEFFALGAELMLLVILLKLKPLAIAAFLPLFTGLALGVIDESLQMLNDRSAEIVDVLKDFLGVTIGVLLVLAVYGAVMLFSNKKRSLSQ